MTITIFLSIFFWACAPYTTDSTEVGVRTNKVGFLMTKGVQDEIYSPGSTSFFPLMVTDWHVFDTAIRNLNMTREHNTGSRKKDDSLRFKTIDGNDISVNITVAWRIIPQKAPYLLQFIGENSQEVEEALVRPVSRTIIRDVLNDLDSEKYYNAELRFKKAAEARVLLNQILKNEGVEIQQVLLGEHQFNQTYQQVIKDMKVAEQDASRLKSETQAAYEEMKRDLEKAKGGAQKYIEKAKGEATQMKLKSDAIFFEKKREAEAILTEKKAKAKGLTERARALAGSGGKSMVKLKVAKALKNKKIIFLPAAGGMDLRTTDVNKLLQTYGLKQATNR